LCVKKVGLRPGCERKKIKVPGGGPTPRRPLSMSPEKWLTGTRLKIFGYIFFGYPPQQNFAQATGVALMPGSDMWIIISIFNREVITAGFGK
jgi:hypothetical protein